MLVHSALSSANSAARLTGCYLVPAALLVFLALCRFPPVAASNACTTTSPFRNRCPHFPGSPDRRVLVFEPGHFLFGTHTKTKQRSFEPLREAYRVAAYKLNSFGTAHSGSLMHQCRWYSCIRACRLSCSPRAKGCGDICTPPASWFPKALSPLSQTFPLFVYTVPVPTTCSTEDGASKLQPSLLPQIRTRGKHF
ncbi:hypothetical protein HDV63DRAFT_301655 [Trichoderma sp. SZMC 28014]